MNLNNTVSVDKQSNYEQSNVEQLNVEQLNVEQLNIEQSNVEQLNIELVPSNKQLVVHSSNFDKELIELYGHLNKLNNIKNSIQDRNIKPHLNMNSKNNVENIGKYGKKIYDTKPLFRDLLTVMEHPEFYSFYYKYMRNWEKFKQTITLMQLYDMISHHLYEKDPLEEKHNGYHKLALLESLLKDKELMRIVFKKHNIKQLD